MLGKRVALFLHSRPSSETPGRVAQRFFAEQELSAIKLVEPSSRRYKGERETFPRCGALLRVLWVSSFISMRFERIIPDPLRLLLLFSL